MITQTKPGIAVQVALRMARQTAAVMAVSVTLGLAFNAVNPIGIKYGAGVSSGKPSLGKELPPARISRSTNGVYQNELLALTLNEDLTRPGGMPDTTSLRTITWEETKALISAKSAVLVDARPAAAFTAGHIPGAVSLPFLSTAAELAEFRRLYDPRTPLIIYCANASCPIAEHLAKKLMSDAGYQSVRIFADGYVEWQRTEGVQTENAPLQAGKRP